MITKMEIINFRNIKHLVVDLKRVSIITGKNNLGKSNSLNALNWLITNKLLTDKYGEGESDIQSIIPTDNRKGDKTSVSIWVDDEIKFTKILKRVYDKLTDKVIKHEPEYQINDSAVKTQKSFYDDLYSALHFNTSFEKLKVEENRLFTDPLYALLKLDYKELRKLLVVLGCSVSNEEIYKLGFEDMREYEAKYLGKWDVMRKNLNDKKLSLNKDYQNVEAQLDLFNSVEEFTDTKLKQLQEEKTKLILERNNLKTGGISDVLNEIGNKVAKLGIELEDKRNKKKLEYQAQINDLNSKMNNIRANEEKAKLEATKSIREHLEELNNNQLDDKKALADRNLFIGKMQLDIEKNKMTIERDTNNLNQLSEKLGHLINGHDDEITCPICGSSFNLHQEDLNIQIGKLSDDINRLQIEIENLEETNSGHNIELENALKEKDALEEIITERDKQIKAAEFEKYNIEKNFNIDDEIRNIKQEIFVIEEKQRNITFEFENENKEINKLIEQQNEIIANNQKAANEKIEEINKLIDENDIQIREEYSKQADYEKKCELKNTLNLIISQMNDNDSLITRCNAFIHKMVSMINDKAYKLTGFHFVMLEQNLTNEGLTEVCYVVDDKGVPFKDINTARKVEMGIKFIDVIRREHPNDLPILVDRLEGIDDILKIKNFTDKQIICTRVSNDESMNVITED